MADKTGLLTVYKRGQGPWTRIGLATVLGIFVLWFLVSLDATMEPQTQLVVNGTEYTLT